MPHQCVRCGKIYDDGAKAILTGCSCGAKLFFYVKKTDLKKAEKATKKLTDKEKKEIEKDVFDLVGHKENDETPVILDFESIKISEPGKYEIDLLHLFKREPLVYKMGKGKYVIDLPQVFKKDKD